MPFVYINAVTGATPDRNFVPPVYPKEGSKGKVGRATRTAVHMIREWKAAPIEGSGMGIAVATEIMLLLLRCCHHCTLLTTRPTTLLSTPPHSIPNPASITSPKLIRTIFSSHIPFTLSMWNTVAFFLWKGRTRGLIYSSSLSPPLHRSPRYHSYLPSPTPSSPHINFYPHPHPSHYPPSFPPPNNSTQRHYKTPPNLPLPIPTHPGEDMRSTRSGQPDSVRSTQIHSTPPAQTWTQPCKSRERGVLSSTGYCHRTLLTTASPLLSLTTPPTRPTTSWRSSCLVSRMASRRPS